jgi:hypothetical protein
MTGQALERHQGVEPISDREWAGLERKARVLANSSLVPEHFRKKPDEVLLVGLTAHDLGIQLTLTNLGQFYVVKNRVGLMAQLQIGLAARAGHEFRWGPCNERSASVDIRRRGSSEWQTFTFTIERAERAKLLSNDVWKAYPEDMLQCRAVTRAIRRVCPEVLLGIPAFDDTGLELEEDDALEGEVVEDAPALDAGPMEAPTDDDPAAADGEDEDEADPAAALRNDRTAVQAKINQVATARRADLAAAWREANLPRVHELTAEQLGAADAVVELFLAPAEEPKYGPGEEPF